ncbi:unnamed protein product [Caenorhabditis sp. 36 PRJEB53466]|nr:unnamed protein product [Caenorhabditis sp. 36 PRJEB53466]
MAKKQTKKQTVKKATKKETKKETTPIKDDNSSWCNMVEWEPVRHHTHTCEEFQEHTWKGCDQLHMECPTALQKMKDRHYLVNRKTLHHKVTADHNKYRSMGMEQKRQELSLKIIKLVDETWAKVLITPFSVAQLDSICLAVTFAELWGWTNRVMVSEHHEYGVFLPVTLVREFVKGYEMLEKVTQKMKVAKNNYEFIIKLRDEVVKFLQTMYRITVPLRNGTELHNPNDMNDIRYVPYDQDWLRTSSFSLYETNGWATISRINQIALCQERLNILFAAKNIPLPPNAHKCPRKFEPTRLLEEGYSNDIEYSARMYYYDTCKQLVELDSKDSLLQNTNAFHYFQIFSSLIRSRKKDLLVEISGLAGQKSQGFIYAAQQLMAVFVVLETHFLLIQRVFAPYMDNDLGMFGFQFPSEVGFHMQSVFKTILTGNHADLSENRALLKALDLVREAVADSVKDFFLHQEYKMEQLVRGSTNIDFYKNLFDRHTIPIRNRLNNKDLIRNMKLENIELWRLRNQRQLAFEALALRLQGNDAPKFAVNQFNPKTGVFFSNHFDLRNWHAAQQLGREMFGQWKTLCLQISGYPSEYVGFVGAEFAAFMDQSLPKHITEDVRSSLTLSFTRAVTINFMLTEVEGDKIIIDINRGRFRLRKAAEMLLPLIKHSIENKKNNLQENFKTWCFEYETEFTSRGDFGVFSQDDISTIFYLFEKSLPVSFAVLLDSI